MLFTRLRSRVGLMMIALAGLMAIVAILRALQIESSTMAIFMVAAVPIMLIPAYVVAGYAIVTRRRGLAAVGVLLVLAQLFWSASEFGLGRGGDGVGPAFRLATANVLADNDAVGVLFESLAARDAEVVLLQEMTPEQLDRVSATSSYADYPHRVLDARPGAHGSVILSKFPITDGGVIWPGGWPMTEAVITHPNGERTRIINVHTIAPLTRENITIWEQQFADLKSMVDGSDLPVIIAGDFNATAQHRGVRAIVGLGLDDAHLDAGFGWGATFPAGSLTPSILRLDRVLMSDTLHATSIDRLDPLGSDHRPLLVGLGFT